MKSRILYLCILLSAAFVLGSSFHKFEKEIFLWCEAENADEIIAPVKLIEDYEASNGKGIVSLARSHFNIGSAVYTLNVPISSNFNTWFRVYWINGCSNAFLLKIDNSNKCFIGNDVLLQCWHWIRGPKYFFNKGSHTIELISEERNSRMDKMLFTTNSYFIPQGIGEVFDFDCSFNREELMSFFMSGNRKKWKIVNDEFINGNRMYYLDKVDHEEYTVLKLDNKNNFSFNISFKSLLNSKEINVRLLFGKINLNNFLYLDFEYSRLTIGYVQDGEENTLLNKKLEQQLDPMTLYTVQIIRLLNDFEVILNGKSLLNFIDKSSIFEGNIGFGSKTGKIYFDDLIYRRNLEPSIGDNFFKASRVKEYLTDPTKTRDVIDSPPWIEISGAWKFIQLGDLRGICTNSSSYALIINGEDYWQDYKMMCAINPPRTGVAGLCFYYQDPMNFYRFDVIQNNLYGSYVRLIRKQDGEEKVLDNHQIQMRLNNWYKFQIEVHDSEIKCFIDEKELIRLHDNTFIRGKIGLYTTAKEQYAVFDDVFINSIWASEEKDLNVYTYVFDPRINSSLDLCDWDMNNCNYNIDDNPYLQIQKPILENVSMRNKMVFNDVIITLDFVNPPGSKLVTAVKLYDDKMRDGYRFEISDQFSKIYQNEILLEKSVCNNNFKKIVIEKGRNKLMLKADSLDILRLEDVSPIIDTKYIDIGFKGIAETTININKIEIKKL